MKTLIYTFRTFPFKNKIPGAFVFGRLNEDFSVFSKKILKENPDIIMGIARSEDYSRFERLTVNRFNKTKKINLNGKDSFTLDLSSNLIFPLSNRPTDSFCNWTAYKIKEFLEKNELKIKLSFIHITERDIENYAPLFSHDL